MKLALIYFRLNKIIPVILIVFTFSCSRNKQKHEGKTVFRYNEPVGITSLDPAFAKDKAKIWACNQIYNGLVQLDNNLNVRPCIAKRWEILDRGKTYRFILKDSIYFHDHQLFPSGKGRKVVAKDFVYSFKRVTSPKTASPGKWVFNNVAKINKEYAFIAENDSSFVIKLNNPLPPFLGLLSMQYCSVVPSEIVEHYGKDFRKNPIGTGPFHFKMWKEGEKLVLLKNKNYFEFEDGKRLPYLDAVAISFIIDRQSAFLEFVKGNLDLLSGIHASYKDELLTHKGTLNPKYKDRFKLYTQPYLNTEYLGFLMDDSLDLHKNSPIRHKKIRQAINYGFNRVKMMAYLRNNIGTPALNGFIPKGLPGYDTTANFGYEYSPVKAEKLIKEAGFPNGKGLSPIELSTNKDYLDICKYIQHQLSNIGIPVEINVMPAATLRENMAQSKVVFFRGSWIADYPDAENYLSLFYSKNYAPEGPNYTHFHSKSFDSLYRKASEEVNDSVRLVLYRKMDSLVMEKAAVVPLYYDQVLRFTHKGIRGLESNPMNLLKLKRVKKVKEKVFV